jgi:hypothetical protein
MSRAGLRPRPTIKDLARGLVDVLNPDFVAPAKASVQIPCGRSTTDSAGGWRR